MPYPQQYSTDITENLPAMFAGGESVSEVCIKIGISRQTFYRWQKEYPEFAEACEQGKMASEAWWNMIGRAAVTGKVPGFNASTWIFTMKNRFAWKDKVDIGLEAEAGTALIPQEMNSLDEWSKQAQDIMEKQQSNLIEHSDTAAEA